LLRPLEAGEKSYPIYLNLFPDLGFRIHVYRHIEKDYGDVWLAAPEPVYDGRRFIEISSNSYNGTVAVVFDSRALGLGAISVVGVDGTTYVAVVEYATSARTWSYAYRPGTSSFLLSKSSNSFSAETSVSVAHSGLDFAFPEESVGYFMTTGGDRPHPLPATLYKTEDGGTSWRVVAARLPGTPKSLYFRTAMDGYAWSDITCQGAPCGTALVRTADGGATWARIGEPVFGPLGGPAFIDARIGGALFAIFGRPAPDARSSATVLARSDDRGETWSDLFTFPAGDVDAFVTGEAFGEKVYVAFWNGTIYAIDPVRGAVERIEVGGTALQDFAVVSEETLVAIVGGTEGFRLVRSRDRGASWTTVREGLLRLIAAPALDELFLIVNKETIRSSDTATMLDVVVYSADGGETWEESEPTVHLVFNRIGMTSGRQSANGAHRVLLTDRVLTVRVPARD
jgi:photosystem II stability/assembly factor-like uncharacterized protein